MKQNRTLITDIYCKQQIPVIIYFTQLHTHSVHKKINVPYKLAKQVKVFVTCKYVLDQRLKDMKH